MIKHFLMASGVTLLLASSGMAGGASCDPNRQRVDAEGILEPADAETYGGTGDRGTGTWGPTGSGAIGAGQDESEDVDSHHGRQDPDDGFEGGDAGAEDPGNQHLGTPRSDDGTQ